VKVWVMAVDQERRRVSLTMIRPGTERKPLEKSSPQPGTQMGGKRPPRGRRPAPRHGQGAKPGQPPARTALTPETSAGVSPPSVPASGENMVATPPAARESTPPPAPRPAPPHRKPQRHPPKAKLTKAALEGDTPLRTFGELKAFFEAKGKDTIPGRPDSSREKNAENKEQGTGNP
jgi:protein Tex